MRPHATQVIDTAARAEQQRQPRHHAERGPAVEEAVEQQGAQRRHASASASEVKAAMSGSMGPRSRATRYLVYSVISRLLLPGHIPQSSRLQFPGTTGCGTISMSGDRTRGVGG